MTKPKAVSTRFAHKSFYLTPSDREMLEKLEKAWGMNDSAIIRRAITEACERIRWEEKT
jgi:hypothetical protein